MRAGVDGLDREGEVEEHERGQREHVAAGYEQEGGGRDHAAEEHDVVEPRQPDVILDVPERHDHQRVGAHLQLQEALVRDQRRQHRRDARRHDSVDARPRRTAVDPDEQGGQEQRRDDEHVPLDDRAGEAGGERGDDDQRPGRQCDGGSDEGLHRGLE